MAKVTRGTRTGLVALLVALTMLFATLPAAAGNGNGRNSDGGTTTQNVTWE